MKIYFIFVFVIFVFIKSFIFAAGNDGRGVENKIPATSITITGILRDVWPCNNSLAQYPCGQQANPTVTCIPADCQPDFEYGPNGLITGLVSDILGPDRTPVFAGGPTIHSNATFYSWFHDVEGINMAYPWNLTWINYNPLCGDNGDGVWSPCDPWVFEYINESFFPLDFSGFGNYRDNHNYHFTLEIHGRFVFQHGQKMSFTSEDDLWVFVNDKLVVDFGGIHPPSGGLITTLLNLDTMEPKLTENISYSIDIFYANRKVYGSNFKWNTDANVYCPWFDGCGVCQGNGQSCCNLPGCTSDLCTQRSCALLNSSICVETPIVNCDNGNLCQIGTCNPNTGNCSYTDVICNDNNKCTDDKCIPDVGCEYIEKRCNSTTCINGSCDPNTGSCTFTPVNCDDGNECTSDICINLAGCVSKEIDCPTKVCHVSYCNSSVGCLYTPVSCDDNDACTYDFCNETNGACEHVLKSCPSGGCYEGLCNSTTGNCYNQTISSCDKCANVICDTINPCFPSYCDPTTGLCTNKTINCTDNNPCTDDVCIVTNNNSATCQYIEKNCNGNLCQTGSCDINNGQCVYQNISCYSNNLCIQSSYCNITDGTCNYIPTLCPEENACNIASCNPSTGTCSYTNICNDGNNCTLDICNSNGTCSFPPKCDDSNPCTIDVCSSNGTCNHISPCDDSDPCTNDYCNITSSGGYNCTYVPVNVTQPENKCLVSYCDKIRGILTTPYLCEPAGDCSCTPTQGCVCQHNSGFLNNPIVQGVGATTIALATIGAAAGVGAAIFGGKKGYDYFTARNAHLHGVNENPLYEGNQNEGNNPLYENES